MMPDVDPRLRAPWWCLCSVFVLAYSPIIKSDDFMGNQRLFFTARERQNAIEVTPSDVNDGMTESAISKKRSKQTLKSVRREGKDKSEVHSALTNTILFNGLVRGQNKVQVLLNGKPCLPVSNKQQNSLEKPATLVCPHLTATSSSFQFNKMSGQLLIRVNGVIKARLSPGERN